ncbi:MAG: MBL fold metallo-hydrolase [Chloroflexi bacterium]|nr:MBL fold metallo-hydrolase [Chloroflexota bacterium]
MAIPVTEVAKGILRIGPLESAHSERTSHWSALTSPYLVVGKERAALVEPGEDVQVPGTVEAIKTCGVGLDRVAYVWASHIHLHHIQALPTLLPHFPNAKFVVHPRGAPHVIEPTRLVQSTLEVWGDKCYGPFSPIPRERVMPVDDGQVLDLGGKELEIIHAPGHAPHHMGLLDRQTRALFFGDTSRLDTPGYERGYHDIRPPLFDVEKFVASIHRFQSLRPSIILTFTYGGVSHSPENTLRWALEDHLAIERICLEGLREKQTFREIWRRVGEYETRVGGGHVAAEPEAGSGQVLGMVNYLKRKYPDLEMPGDLRRKRTF